MAERDVQEFPPNEVVFTLKILSLHGLRSVAMEDSRN